MKKSRYRTELNDVLVNLVKRSQPLYEKYQVECSGVKNAFVESRAKEIIAKISEVRECALEAAEEAYTSYLKRLDKKAKSITGKDIDSADIVLLESNLYTLNQEEFDVLQDKYEGNRSMERILAGYAEKKGNGYNPQTGKTDIDNQLVCRFMSDQQKQTLANQLYKECVSWIKSDEGHGIADYVVSMAGDMFGAADKLKE